MRLVKVYDELREMECYFDYDKLLAVVPDSNEDKVFNSVLLLPEQVSIYSKKNIDEIVNDLEKQIKPKARKS